MRQSGWLYSSLITSLRLLLVPARALGRRRGLGVGAVLHHLVVAAGAVAVEGELVCEHESGGAPLVLDFGERRQGLGRLVLACVAVAAADDADAGRGFLQQLRRERRRGGGGGGG